MGKVGKIKVCLDKPYYCGGDTVSGQVFLELLDEIDVDRIYLKVKGKEKVVWKEHYRIPQYEEDAQGQRALVGHEEAEDEFDEKEAFFKKKISLVPAEDFEMKPGKYKFPFSFILPTTGKKGSALPGMFDAKGYVGGWAGVRHGGRVKELKAKVEYSIKAVVDIDDSKDIEEKVDFAVYEQLPKLIPTPSDEKSASVMFCCCINRGDLTMNATLDKSVYCPGEKARAVLTVHNRSALQITAMAEMNRYIKLRADDHQIVSRNEYNLGRFDIIEPGEEKTVEMIFEIPNMYPSTRARNLQCSYVLDIVSELQCAPDIELHFPVHIYTPPKPPSSWLSSIPDHEEYIEAGSSDVTDMEIRPEYCAAAPA